MTTTTRSAITRRIGSLFGQARSQLSGGPEDLAESFALGNAELYREGRLIEQAVLAKFIDEGHLSAHLRRVRSIYEERRNVPRQAIESRLGDLVSTTGGLAGLHLPYLFNQAIDDLALSHEMLAAGIVLRPLSMYYADSRQSRSGMILGFAAVDAQAIDAAAAQSCAAVERRSQRERK